MIGHSACVLLALGAFAASSGTTVPKFAHGQWTAGQDFQIETADQLYRGRLLDRATGECQMEVSSDGRTFGPSRTVYLLGATAGPQARQTLVLMREIKVG